MTWSARASAGRRDRVRDVQGQLAGLVAGTVEGA